jgi:hypothetical protein
LLGFQFAPRIPDLKSRRLYSVGKASAYPSLEPLIAGRINVVLIRAHWSEILRVAASIRTGTVTASLILRQLVGPAHAQYLGELGQHLAVLRRYRLTVRRSLGLDSQRREALVGIGKGRGINETPDHHLAASARLMPNTSESLSSTRPP